MADKFASEMIFSLSSLPHKDRFTFFGGRLVSSAIDLEEKGADLQRDIFMPIVVESVATTMELKDGIYKVFVTGEVNQVGVDEYDWLFTEHEVIYTPLSVAPHISMKEEKKYKYTIRE